MRMCYLAESVGRTGGNVVLFHHMEALSRDGHEVWLIGPYGKYKWAPGSLDPVMLNPGRTFKPWWRLLNRVRRQLHEAWPAAQGHAASGDMRTRAERVTERLLAQWRPCDMTIATHSFSARAAAEKREVTQAFYFMQGFEPWFDPDPAFQEISLNSYSLPLSRIANSSWLQEKVSGLTGDSVALVRPGLNHEVFWAKPEGRQDRTALPLHVVSYCDPRPLKGWSDSQEAMGIVFERQHSSAQLVWSVFGHRQPTTSSAPATFAGFLPHRQLSALYRQADVVFVPSWFESFPLQPVEAMACGAAVVTTRIGTSDFAHNGDTALVVEPREPAALAEATLRLLGDSDLRHRLSSRGMEHVKKYTWTAAADELRAALGL